MPSGTPKNRTQTSDSQVRIPAPFRLDIKQDFTSERVVWLECTVQRGG